MFDQKPKPYLTRCWCTSLNENHRSDRGSLLEVLQYFCWVIFPLTRLRPAKGIKVGFKRRRWEVGLNPPGSNNILLFWTAFFNFLFFAILLFFFLFPCFTQKVVPGLLDQVLVFRGDKLSPRLPRVAPENVIKVGVQLEVMFLQVGEQVIGT